MIKSSKVARKTTTLHHRIRSVSVTGGFLDGARFDLEDGLNCFIGARGTGKTTVLELIRFAFDGMPSKETDPTERRRIATLVERNLAGGHVQVTVETQEGLIYRVQRSADEEPLVLSKDGKPTENKLKSGGLFQLDIYSQNAVEELADRATSQLTLIDNFEAEKIADIVAKLTKVKQGLRANAAHVMPLQDKIGQLAEEISTLPGIEEKLKGFAGRGKGTADKIGRAHESKALRDREKHALKRLNEFLAEYSTGLSALKGQLREETESLIDEEMLSGANAESLKDIKQDLLERGKKIDQLIQKAGGEITEEFTRLKQAASALSLRHHEQDLAFQKIFEKDRQAQKQATERSRLERTRNELSVKQRERKESCRKLEKLLDARKGLLHEFSELQDQRFNIRQEIVKTINAQLSPNIRAKVLQYGNRVNLQRLLEEALKGSGVKYSKVSERLSSLWPAEFAAAVRENDTDALVENAEISQDQAEKVIATFRNSDRLFELESVELLDLPQIELLDGDEYKELSVLSQGQKCIAVLPILLLDSARPLLVDQPEDNLDNSFIYETVVANIRKVKSTRQLIFVTHNANIPVLGDANQVFVLDSDGTSARLANEGTVDDCKEDILTLLEGGRKAFRLRRQRYGT